MSNGWSSTTRFWSSSCTQMRSKTTYWLTSKLLMICLGIVRGRVFVSCFLSRRMSRRGSWVTRREGWNNSKSLLLYCKCTTSSCSFIRRRCSWATWAYFRSGDYRRMVMKSGWLTLMSMSRRRILHNRWWGMPIITVTSRIGSLWGIYCSFISVTSRLCLYRIRCSMWRMTSRLLRVGWYPRCWRAGKSHVSNWRKSAYKVTNWPTRLCWLVTGSVVMCCD